MTAMLHMVLADNSAKMKPDLSLIHLLEILVQPDRELEPEISLEIRLQQPKQLWLSSGIEMPPFLERLYSSRHAEPETGGETGYLDRRVWLCFRPLHCGSRHFVV